MNIGFFSMLLLLAALIACQPAASEQVSESLPSTDSINTQSPETQLSALTNQISINPKDYTLFEQRSRLYYDMDSLDQASADLEMAVSLHPEGPELHYLQGFYHYVQNDTARAMKSLREAARLGSSNPEVFYLMGQIFFLQQNDEMALRLYQKSAELDSSQAIYIFAQGYLAEQRNRPLEANQLYKSSIAIDPGFAKALCQLHDLHFDHFGNELEAMKYVDQLLQYHPSHGLGRFYQGNYHMRRVLAHAEESTTEFYKNEVNEAVVNYSIAINKHPQFLQAVYNRGFCYFLGQNFDRAIPDFEEATRIDPNHIPSYLMLGDIFKYFKDFEQAKSFYEKVQQIDPANEDAKQKIANLLL